MRRVLSPSSIMRSSPTARSSTRIAFRGGELRRDLQGLTLQLLLVVTGRAGRIGLGPVTLCESGLLWRASRRDHDSPPSRLPSAASAMFRPSLAMAASRGDSHESRHDSGRGKLVLECFFANSPRSTKVGF